MSDATQAATATGDTHLGGSATGAPAPAPAAPAPSPAPAAPAPAPAAPAPSPAPTPAPSPAPAAAKTGEEGKEGKPADDGKSTGAPEKYADFTFPEGVKVDEARMGKFTEWAKSNNLSQEAAQAAMDMAVDLRKGDAEQLQAAIDAQAEAWGNEAKADKEFGGDKFDENLAVAKRALDQFGTPELKTLLKASKMGNHPEVLRVFYRIGQAISQDGFVPGRSAAAKTATPQSMYSASNMNP